MLSKASSALIFVLALIAAANISAAPQVSDVAIQSRADPAPLIVGSRVAGDRLLSEQTIVKTSSWLSVVTHDFNYKTPRNEIITLVVAANRKFNGYGAAASLLSGGPGSTSVNLRFKSQRSHGINYTVSIYGR